MSQVNAQALKTYAEAYGIAVRAGVITPNKEDEAALRKMFALPEMPQEVIVAWAKSDGVKAPIALAQEQSPPVAAEE